jgi:hypothetical protein
MACVAAHAVPDGLRLPGGVAARSVRLADRSVAENRRSNARSTRGPLASAELSRRIEKVVGYPPLSELGDLQRREFHEALLDADAFEDLPGKSQAAIVEAEQKRPMLRLVDGEVGKSRDRHRSLRCRPPLTQLRDCVPSRVKEAIRGPLKQGNAKGPDTTWPPNPAGRPESRQLATHSLPKSP